MFALLDPTTAPRIRGCLQFETIAVRKAEEFVDEWQRACRKAALEPLFDLAAQTEWLPVVAPTGRLGSDFIPLCRKVGARLSAALKTEQAALRLGGALERRIGRFDSSSPPGLELVAAALSPSERARLRSLARGYRGEPEEGLAPGELSIPGTRVIAGKSGALRARAELAGSRIGVGPALSGNTQQLRIGAATDPRALRRLGLALRLLDAAWPEGGLEVRRRTRLILTLDEPGLVSYSHLHRPGVTYVNLRGKTIVDLADDLLHETAHHRLHAVEEQKRLVRANRGEEIRYWSPWRRALRPVRGIVHAAYTFSFRAELLERMWKATGKDRLRREAAAERRHVARALVDLKDAARRGLLTARGERLVEAIDAARARRKPA